LEAVSVLGLRAGFSKIIVDDLDPLAWSWRLHRAACASTCLVMRPIQSSSPD
jgi:hypothetical protein